MIFPATVTTIEYLTSAANPIGNFGALGYSQVAFPALAQLTALTGLLGLSFVMSWFASIVVWAWDHGFAWKRVRAGVLGYALLLLVAEAGFSGYTPPLPGAHARFTATANGHDGYASDTYDGYTFVLEKNKLGQTPLFGVTFIRSM